MQSRLLAGLAVTLFGLIGAAGVSERAEAAATSFTAVADARVDEANPSQNYGASSLRVNGGSDLDVDSYLRFTVSGISSAVSRATLRIFATSDSVQGPSVYLTSDTWTEAGLTWANRPPRIGPALASAGPVSPNAWIELDVTSVVNGNGAYDLVLGTSSSDGINMSSREASANRPQLLIDTGPAPPTNVTPPTLLGPAQSGQLLLLDEGVWNGSASASERRWLRCAFSGCTQIDGAFGLSYVLGPEDAGAQVAAEVTRTNAYGSATAQTARTAVIGVAPPRPPAVTDPVFAVAGDVAGSWSSDEATAAVIDRMQPTWVLMLGDSVYNNGTPAEFAEYYAPTWGRHLAITSPTVGNHDYGTPGASGYYGYFGAAAGDPSRGFYAFDVGDWRVYTLNSNCSIVPCAAGSEQERWLRADLAAHPRTCRLATAHHPRFASTGSLSELAALYQAFYDGSGDLWLSGHWHQYERLAQLSPSGAIDGVRGVRNFVVGTGGVGLRSFGSTITGSQVRNSNTHGVLKLTLRSSGYEWAFVPVPGKSFTDAGTGACSAVSDSTPPSSPSGLTATANGSRSIGLAWTAATDNVGVTGYDLYRDGTLLASLGAVTAYLDATVAPATTYSYVVVARDQADNISAPSNTASATTGAPEPVRTFVVAADARVQEANPATNYGTSYLRADGAADPDVESYLRFAVSGLTGSVTAATLRVFAYSGTSDGPALYSGSNTWTEAGLTWSTRPGRGAVIFGDLGKVSSNSWLEYDVTAAVTGDGTYSFVLATATTDGVNIYSREGAQPPQLVVTTTG